MHSYLIVSNNQEEVDNQLSILIPFENFAKSPDFLVLDNEGSIGISELRAVQQFLAKKPYQESHKVVYVPEANRLTIPAQQAFLKTLEEPPENSLLILSLVNEANILPTIISRCQVIRIKSSEDVTGLNDDRKVEIEKLVNKLKSTGVGDRVLVAQDWAYPKTKASQLVLDLIFFFRQELTAKADLNVVHNLKLADVALARLQQNVDSRLTIEDLFLKIK